jgi:phage gp36-like protein
VIYMYCSVDDIRGIFEENDIDNKAVITDQEVIKIITNVDAEIDAALGRRYTTPFTSVPQLINTISQYKSTAEAMQQILQGSNGALIKPEAMKYYRTKGEKMLEDLRTGRLEITGSRRLQMSATTL